MNNKKQQILTFFAGLLTILIILEVGLRIAGYCYQKSRVTFNRTVTSGQKDNFVILCLGNSYTLGSGAPPGESYPDHLQGLFNERNKENAIVINGGVNSENTAELLDNLKAGINNVKPDLIILQTGQPNWWNFYKYSNYLERTSVGNKPSFNKISYSLHDFLYKSRVYRLLFLLKNNINTKLRSKKAADFSYRHAVEYGALGELMRNMDKDFFADGQKVNKAINVLKKGIEVDPDYPKSYELLGCIYLYQKNYDEALRLFMQAVMVNPGFRDIGGENKGYGHIRNMRNMPMGGQKERIRKTIDKFIQEFKKTHPKNCENLLLLENAEISRWAESDVIEIVKIIQSKNIRIILQNYPVSTKFQAGAIDDILRNVAMRFNIPFVDNNNLFKKIIAAEGEKVDEEYFVPDGHCNSRGYKIMANNVYNKIVEKEMFERKLNHSREGY